MSNILILCAASLLVGFIVGIVLAGPRRWDTFICDPRDSDHSHPDDAYSGPFEGGFDDGRRPTPTAATPGRVGMAAASAAVSGGAVPGAAVPGGTVAPRV